MNRHSIIDTPLSFLNDVPFHKVSPWLVLYLFQSTQLTGTHMHVMKIRTVLMYLFIPRVYMSAISLLLFLYKITAVSIKIWNVLILKSCADPERWTGVPDPS